MDPIHCSIRHQEPCPLCATYDNRNVRMLEFGNPREWDKIHYFSFISRQTYEPFAEEN